jgi:hypothetical protein
MNKRKENDYLSQLAEMFGVTDVYFHKGYLFVINAYDIPAVEDFLEMAPDIIGYRLTTEDQYA